MTGRSAALAVLAAAGVLGLIASAQPWWRASGEGATVTFSGAEATGGLSQALAVVVLAGALLGLVLRGAGRRVLAVLLALAAAGMVAVGALRLPPSAESVRTRFRQVSLVEQFALQPTAWCWLYAVAGLAGLFGAVLLWRRGGRPEGASRRFERAAVAAEGRPVALPADGSMDAAVAWTDDPGAAWRAQDAGLDPTEVVVEEAADVTTTRSSAVDPDVRIEGRRATMDGKQTPEK